MKSVYVVGGAGTGKSTFTAEVFAGHEFGPLLNLAEKPNKKNIVTLRGHEIAGGIYLGRMRDSFPGTDGLDRASSPVGSYWLEEYGHNGYQFIYGEGATPATRPFLETLEHHTELTLLHLVCDPMITDLRFLIRKSNQDPSFVANTVTRSANLAAHMKGRCEVVEVLSDWQPSWDDAVSKTRSVLGLA